MFSPLQSTPLIRFKFNVDILATPEEIFPYFVDVKKIESWQSFDAP